MFHQNSFASKEWRIVGGAAIAAALLWIWAYLPQPPVLRVTFLDVGEGDAIVVQAPNGETALIDAGPGHSKYSRVDAGERNVLPYLKRLGVTTLDAVVVTHPHDDHVGGMASVLKSVRAKMVIDCGANHISPGYVSFLDVVKKQDIPFYTAQRGDELRLGDAVFKILNPPSYRTEADLNDRSIVLKLIYGQTSFLLAADAGREAEIDMLDNCSDLESAVLKVAHHGAKDATTEAFLNAVCPMEAIISVGYKNGFDHPSKETIARLERHGARVYRTDRQGAVTIESDGKYLAVSTCR